MLIDTDVLIEFQRGSLSALRSLERVEDLAVSLQSAMEFLQGARNQRELRLLKAFLSEQGFQVIPLTENIGHRALIYIEEYALSHGLRAADALVAATAVENDLPLMTGNARHFRPVKDLELVSFRSS